MTAQTAFPVGAFPADISLSEEGPGLGGLPRNTMPAPQLVMLANVAAVTAAEASGGDGSVADEKEMMELKTVGGSFSDSEDEGVIRYSYDNQSHREVCIVEYPESPSEQVVDAGGRGDEDPPPVPRSRPSPAAAEPGAKGGAESANDGAKKKKPFRCKPCHFQAQNEHEFVEHLSSHSASKMMVVSQVEGRSKGKPQEAETPQAGGEAAAAGDVKGLIRCERCGYNTNRYDHYISHLKHHSKEGDDHRVFRCTLCQYMTVSQYHWRKHLRNHFPSKLHTCSQCSYFSDRKSNYVQHIRTHTGVRPFRCLYCDYSSSQKTHLTRHMRTHSGERPFKCDICPYLAANQHEVTRHARQVHNGPKPLSCPYCDYKTADRSNFKKHVELHLNPRQFVCPLCQYAGSKKCNLQYHIKSRHSGCSVALDVSKVKLRVKRCGPDPADPADGERSPVNLSVRKPGRSDGDRPVQKSGGSDGDRPVQKSGGSDGDRPVQKSGGDRPVQKPPEKQQKMTTRQRKAGEGPAETATATAAKRRVRKAATDRTEDPTQNQQNPAHASQNRDPEPKITSEKGDKPPRRSRKSGCKRSEKNLDRTRDSSPKPDGSERNQKPKEVKEKPAKRKPTEVLDLSQKSSKSRRLKSPDQKPPPKCAPPEPEPGSSPAGTGTGSDGPPPQKKSKSGGKKGPALKLSVAPVQSQNQTAGPVDQGEAPPSCSGPAGPGPAPLRASDPEDDEGIHSSHEAGSDISDSASEGSDDSGLNGAGAAAKMADDPETPGEEVATPTELRSHTCIFCDRSFPLEAVYRRHLNRHLVNVYYLDAAEAQK